MIDLETLGLSRYTMPDVIDWDRVRTYWVCPELSAVRVYPDAPVAVRGAAEEHIRCAFHAAIPDGPIRHLWLGEPMRDGVDWMDERVWYPLRVVFDGDPPQQQLRPFRLGHAPDVPGEPFELFCRSLVLMGKGDFAAGLPLYEYRWQIPQAWQQWTLFEMPLWDGHSSGRVLIYGEQGAGDIIHFSRFLKHVDFEADLVCPSPSVRLMELVDFRGDVLPHANREYDWHLPLCSLPLVLGLDMCEPTEPYIDVPRVEHYGYRVGVCWSGNPTHLENSLRCLTLEDVLEHVPEHAEVVNLQYGPAREQIRHCDRPVADLMGTDVKDWYDTARLVAQCDAVVTVDTGIVHLAGAMGVPTKLLMGGSRDWRWPGIPNLYPSVERIIEHAGKHRTHIVPCVSA